MQTARLRRSSDLAWDLPEGGARLEVLAPRVRTAPPRTPSERDRAIWRALDALAAQARRVAFFVVRGGMAESFAAKAEGPVRSVRNLRISLDDPSAFQRSVASGEPSWGRGSDPSGPSLVVPVIGDNRVIGLLYAEGVSAPGDSEWAAEIARDLGEALATVFAERRARRATQMSEDWAREVVSRF